MDSEWMVVEIMGHRRYGALVTEVERFGVKMLKAEVASDPPFVQYVAPSSIFALTPCSEAVARAACAYVTVPTVERALLPSGDDDVLDGDEPSDVTVSLEEVGW